MGNRTFPGALPQRPEKNHRAAAVYAACTEFHATMKEQVEAYFKNEGLRPRGLPAMYGKASLLALWYGATYALLYFTENGFVALTLLAISLGLAMSGIGFNIAHDACHGAFSSSPKANRFLSFALDVIGGSSYVWKRKHNIFHHTYTNLTGADDDIDLGLLARLSPHQERIGIHRFQYLYIWLLYAWLGIAWQYIDLSRVLQGRIGANAMQRPKGWSLVVLILGKIVFFGLMLGLPIYQVGLGRALFVFFIASFTLGWTTAIVFQLAHCVESAEFPALPADTKLMENDWAIHQLETTVNFAPRNPLLTWYLGGLNYQVEHHLFPKICHLHYPALAPIIQRVCEQFEVRYRVYPTMLQAIRSHYRFLKQTYMFPAPQSAGSDNA